MSNKKPLPSHLYGSASKGSPLRRLVFGNMASDSPSVTEDLASWMKSLRSRGRSALARDEEIADQLDEEEQARRAEQEREAREAEQSPSAFDFLGRILDRYRSVQESSDDKGFSVHEEEKDDRGVYQDSGESDSMSDGVDESYLQQKVPHVTHDDYSEEEEEGEGEEEQLPPQEPPDESVVELLSDSEDDARVDPEPIMNSAPGEQEVTGDVGDEEEEEDDEILFGDYDEEIEEDAEMEYDDLSDEEEDEVGSGDEEEDNEDPGNVEFDFFGNAGSLADIAQGVIDESNQNQFYQHPSHSYPEQDQQPATEFAFSAIHFNNHPNEVDNRVAQNMIDEMNSFHQADDEDEDDDGLDRIDSRLFEQASATARPTDSQIQPNVEIPSTTKPEQPFEESNETQHEIVELEDDEDDNSSNENQTSKEQSESQIQDDSQITEKTTQQKGEENNTISTNSETTATQRKDISKLVHRALPEPAKFKSLKELNPFYADEENPQVLSRYQEMTKAATAHLGNLDMNFSFGGSKKRKREEDEDDGLKENANGNQQEQEEQPRPKSARIFQPNIHPFSSSTRESITKRQPSPVNFIGFSNRALGLEPEPEPDSHSLPDPEQAQEHEETVVIPEADPKPEPVLEPESEIAAANLELEPLSEFIVVDHENSTEPEQYAGITFNGSEVQDIEMDQDSVPSNGDTRPENETSARVNGTEHKYTNEQETKVEKTQVSEDEVTAAPVNDTEDKRTPEQEPKAEQSKIPEETDELNLLSPQKAKNTSPRGRKKTKEEEAAKVQSTTRVLRSRSKLSDTTEDDTNTTTNKTKNTRKKSKNKADEMNTEDLQDNSSSKRVTRSMAAKETDNKDDEPPASPSTTTGRKTGSKRGTKRKVNLNKR